MRNHAIFFAAALSLSLTGCSTLTRGLVTGGGAVAGAGAGYALAGDDKDKQRLYSIGGAGAGALATALYQGKDKKVLEEGYENGYTQSASDSIKRHYWLRQQLQHNNTAQAGQTYYYSFPTQGPEAGVETVPHTVTVPIVE